MAIWAATPCSIISVMAQQPQEQMDWAKEAVRPPQPGLEPIYYPQATHAVQYVPATTAQLPPVPPEKTICGLRKVTFWLIMAIVTLAVVVVGVAVGLGAGLGMKNAHQSSTGGTTNSASTTTSTPASIRSLIPTATSATSTSTAAVATSSVCPSANGTTLSSGLTTEYLLLCDSDYKGSGSKTLSSIVLSSFDDCLKLCDGMNYFQSRTDVGCTYNAAGTGEQTPGTCWCMGGSRGTGTNDGNIIASPL